MKILMILTICALSGCSLLRPDPAASGVFHVKEGECSITRVDVQVATGSLTVGTVAGNGEVFVRRGDCSDVDWSGATGGQG